MFLFLFFIFCFFFQPRWSLKAKKKKKKKASSPPHHHHPLAQRRAAGVEPSPPAIFKPSRKTKEGEKGTRGEKKARYNFFPAWLLSAVEMEAEDGNLGDARTSEAVRTLAKKKRKKRARRLRGTCLFFFFFFFTFRTFYPGARPSWPGRNHESSRCDNHFSRELGAGSGGRKAER